MVEAVIDIIEATRSAEQTTESFLDVARTWLREEEVHNGNVEDLAEEDEVVGVESASSAARESSRFHWETEACGRERPVSSDSRSATCAWVSPRLRRMARRLAATITLVSSIVAMSGVPADGSVVEGLGDPGPVVVSAVANVHRWRWAGQCRACRGPFWLDCQRVRLWAGWASMAVRSAPSSVWGQSFAERIQSLRSLVRGGSVRRTAS